MNKEDLKKYNKTWYYWITFNKSPKKWISGRKVKILGMTFFLWKCARSNYKWSETSK